MARLSIKYIERIVAKGRVYYYYKRNKKRHGALPGEPGTLEFVTAYDCIHRTFGKTEAGLTYGTMSALIHEYKQSADFSNLSVKSQSDYRHHLERIKSFMGDVQIKIVTRAVVMKYRDALQHKPATCNYRMAVLRRLMSLAVDRGYILVNPANNPKKLEIGTWEPWNESQLKTMLGTPKQGLQTALYLALYTGQRQADILSMTWQRDKNQRIEVKQEKTGKLVNIPIHRNLRAYLATLEKKSVNMVIRADGIPYKQNHFKHDWKDEMTRLGIEGVVFHGLRKNATNNLLEAGCSEHEVSAITGMSAQMVRHYAKRVNQGRLADSAMRKLEEYQG